MTLDLDKSRWERVSLGVVAGLSREKIVPTDGSIERYVAGEHMASDELRIREWGDISLVDLGPAFHRRFRPGQVLYGSRRTYLRKVAVAEFDGVCANTTFVVETKNTSVLLQEFLPFIMASEAFHAFAIAASRGSVNPYVNWSDIERFEFDLPPRDEQRRLSDLLWAVEQHKQALKELEIGIPEIQSLTFSEYSRHVPDVPLRKWIKRIDAGRSPQAASEPAYPHQHGVLKVSAVGQELFRPMENKRLLDEADFRPQDSISAGDILITRANAVISNVARPCVVDVDYDNLMLSDKTLRLVPFPGYPNRVILAALCAPAFRSHVQESVNGTDAKNISQSSILAGPVPNLEPRSLQRASSDLTTLDLMLTSVSRQVAASQLVKASLLAEVFGGT